MQTVVQYLILLLTSVLLHAQNTVEVTMLLKSNEGKAHAALYDHASKFLKEGVVYQESNIERNTATVTFADLPDGTYAISCYHDEDSNGKLDMTMGVIPSEPYGTSNNARGYYGPPKWEDAKFELKEGQLKKLNINVK